RVGGEGLPGPMSQGLVAEQPTETEKQRGERRVVLEGPCWHAQRSFSRARRPVEESALLSQEVVQGEPGRPPCRVQVRAISSVRVCLQAGQSDLCMVAEEPADVARRTV